MPSFILHVAKFGNMVYSDNMRREYDISLVVNKRNISKVIIDPHYEDNHSESIDDQIILELIKRLDGGSFEPEDIKTPYSYFVATRREGIQANMASRR